MNFLLRFLFFFNVFFSMLSINSQEKNKCNFRSPLGIPILLSGNFGELRSNHFHTGLDIKTNGRINYRIYSIDTGFVSRINVSKSGYGKAIYVAHPNGFTSVYAHLDHFPEKIEKILRKRQYELQTETLTYYLDSLDITVSKGEVIAYSGNTGGSSGPHLHFEIRETKSEHPVNPELFNFEIADNMPPIIKKLKLYSFFNSNSLESYSAKDFIAIKKNHQYHLKFDSIIYIDGLTGFGLKSSDYYNNSSNGCGVYCINMYVDKQLKYQLKFNEIDFETNRQINIHKDYSAYQKMREKIHKMYIHPNNELQIYKKGIGNGLICFKDTLIHEIQIVVGDIKNNISKLKFYVKNKSLSNCENDFSFQQKQPTNVYSSDSSMLVVMDTNTLYDNSPIHLIKKQSIYTFNNPNVPLKRKFILSIKLSKNEPPNRDKLFIGELTKNGNIINKNADISKDWISAEVNKFGRYKIFTDSIPPKINYVGNNFQKNKNQELVFKIIELKSGIEKYNVFIDNKWVLSNFSTKNNRLKVRLDKYTNVFSGDHRCRVEVSDERKNKTVLEFDFKVN